MGLAIGKTNKPLTIVALPPVSEWEELEKLEGQGHQVIRLVRTTQGFQSNVEAHADLISLILDADVILGDRAWRMDKDLRRYLALAIKSARVLRYKDKEDRLDESVAKKELALGLDDPADDGSSTPGEDKQG